MYSLALNTRPLVDTFRGKVVNDKRFVNRLLFVFVGDYCFGSYPVLDRTRHVTFKNTKTLFPRHNKRVEKFFLFFIRTFNNLYQIRYNKSKRIT